VIPRLLHQTAKWAVVAEKWAPLQKRLFELHPGWEYRLWGDVDNDQLINDHYPWLADAYFGMPKPIMRADLIRYVYMHRFGGLYLDTDYEFLKPFDLVDRDLVLPRESADGAPVFLGNCIFASVPEHPFWKAALEDLAQNPPRKEHLTHEDAIIALTGPGFLTRIYLEHFSQDPTILVPPKGWFHPTTPRTDAQYRTIAKDKDCYGVHFCYGSWRALTLKERLKNRLDRWLGR
jgi:mannosyltransferase OCH1-like enzyme